MVIELAIFVIILFLSLRGSSYDTFLLIIALLPFHLFIKNGLGYFANGGDIFAFWKELSILIFSYKVMSIRKFNFDKRLFFIVLIFVVIVVIYYALSGKVSIGLAQLRDHLFTLLFFISLSMCPFNDDKMKGIFKTLVICTFLSALCGILQMFFLNIEISTIKGSIDFIDDSGYIQYRTVSARIMGFERMSGLFSGPNDFGVYISMMFSTCFYLLYSKYGANFSGKWRIFIIITLIISLACLLLSFSRAGWVISFITLGYLAMTGKLNIKLSTLIPVVIFISFVLIAVFAFVPKVSDILNDSISGKEASAAKRGDIISDGINMNISEPFGHGLGTTDTRNGVSEFFVESAFLNIGYEIGLFGLITLIVLHFSIIHKISRIKLHASPFKSLAIGISIASIFISFFSINTYGMPYIYLWWIFIGLGINSVIYKTENL